MEKRRIDKDFITVNELAEIMGIGKSLAYQYVNSNSCPFTVLKVKTRYTIPTNSFYKWYDSLNQEEK